MHSVKAAQSELDESNQASSTRTHERGQSCDLLKFIYRYLQKTLLSIGIFWNTPTSIDDALSFEPGLHIFVTTTCAATFFLGQRCRSTYFRMTLMFPVVSVSQVMLQFPWRFWDAKVKGSDFFGHVPENASERGMFAVFYDMALKVMKIFIALSTPSMLSLHYLPHCNLSFLYLPPSKLSLFYLPLSKLLLFYLPLPRYHCIICPIAVYRFFIYPLPNYRCFIYPFQIIVFYLPSSQLLLFYLRPSKLLLFYLPPSKLLLFYLPPSQLLLFYLPPSQLLLFYLPPSQLLLFYLPPSQLLLFYLPASKLLLFYLPLPNYCCFIYHLSMLSLLYLDQSNAD